MINIENIFNGNPDEWLECLPKYQRDIINKIYSQTENYDEIIEFWLSPSITSNVPFGTRKKEILSIKKIKKEIKLFIIGDEKYKSDRDRILDYSEITKIYFIYQISNILSPILGTASPYLTPVIAIIFITIGKIGINAWIKTQEENNPDSYDQNYLK